MSKIQLIAKTKQETKAAKGDHSPEVRNDDNLRKLGKAKSAGDNLPKVKPTDTE